MASDPGALCAEALKLLARSKNVLISGPPGTGKSRLLSEVAAAFLAGSEESATPSYDPAGAVPIPPETGRDYPSGDRHDRKVFRTVFHQNSKHRDFLSGITLSNPSIPVAANVTGQLVTTAVAAREALIHQVTGTVHWVQCVQALTQAGTTTFIEVGPGKVLTGLLRQIDKALKCLNVEDPISLETTKAAL